MTDDLQAHAADHAIPVRRCDILAALAEEMPAHAEELCRLGALLASVLHFEFHRPLEALRDNYFFFDPSYAGTPLSASEAAKHRAELISAFEETMRAGNFIEIAPEEVEDAERTFALLPVQTKISKEDFAFVRFFRRGKHRDMGVRKTWLGLRRQKVAFDVYDNVVVFVAMSDTPPRRGRRGGGLRVHARPGSILIKYFQNIPQPDLNMLYPGVRVAMRTEDKLMLGVPALAGGIPILLNIVPALSVLILVIGFYLGLVGSIEGDRLKQAVAAISALVALGGFSMRQWMSYQNRRLKYQQVLADHIYFRNVSNNAGVFDYLVGAAEEQETKEAILAYAFLLKAGAPVTSAALDEAVEAWLRQRFTIDTDFEHTDALAKLRRLGLIIESETGIAARPPGEALAALDAAWDRFYDYPPEGRRESV
ncbi:MAG: DUF3754 domain-containing protein [Alphaproteobacteria bacterium]|nr:DUF3754 domain-containing protein [Alphaproteobacteria bacterium]